MNSIKETIIELRRFFHNFKYKSSPIREGNKCLSIIEDGRNGTLRTFSRFTLGLSDRHIYFINITVVLSDGIHRRRSSCYTTTDRISTGYVHDLWSDLVNRIGDRL